MQSYKAIQAYKPQTYVDHKKDLFNPDRGLDRIEACEMAIDPWRLSFVNSARFEENLSLEAF